MRLRSCLIVLIGIFAIHIAPALARTAPALAGPRPPVARVQPTPLKGIGPDRIDNYYWLENRDSPEVLAYLNAENAYAESVMAPTKPLENKLYKEIIGRLKQDDSTVPYKVGGYFYYTRYEEGGEYPIFCRKRGSTEAKEEVLLNGNQLGKGHGYFALRSMRPSSGSDFLAFAADTVGRRFYNIGFKNLSTGQVLPDVIPNVTNNLVWAEDDHTLFYVKQDPNTLRWYRVYAHRLGEPVSSDRLVYEEADSTYDLGVDKTKSRKYVLIEAEQTLATEVQYVDAAHPEGRLKMIEPRQRDHEYWADHLGDAFYIRTNDRAPNFRLMKAPEATPSRDHWTDVIGARPDVFLESFELFRNYLVVLERSQGLFRLRIRPMNGNAEHWVDFGEPAYVASLGDNPEPDTDWLRYEYTSLTTPESVYDYNMGTKEKVLRKRDEVLGGFDPANYRTERIWAVAHDGTHIPISLVYRKSLFRPGRNPLLLYGYGSYGFSTDPEFSSPVLSLLDRGFVYAIAHVRGGEELGRSWYEDGKLLHKRNTFTDFIDCARYLVRKRYADSRYVFAEGGSAGGLLMGAVVNMAPSVFKGVVAQVPFVDVMTTMLDASIPLTTGEYDEWGDPNKKIYYDYMLSYSPYDNVTARRYPNLMVTTGLHDSQVQYWEPAKWVAKLRALKTDQNRLVLITNMEAGHSGSAGRFERHKMTAKKWAFYLDLAGIRN